MDAEEGNDSGSSFLVAAGVGVGALLLIMLASALIILTFLIILRRRTTGGINLTTSRQTRRDSVSSEAGNIQLVEIDHRGLPEVTEEENHSSVRNQNYEEASSLRANMPRIVDYESKVQAFEWDEVTLRVNFTGNPQPTITWTSDQEDEALDEDYSVEQNSDGSLLFVCIERRHTARYHFEIKNNVGSAKGSIMLNVISSEERKTNREKELLSVINYLESNSVKKDDFGEYVADLHSTNNLGFVTQFKSLASGEDGREVSIGTTDENMVLNRFRNIIAYDGHLLPLVPDRKSYDYQHEYINASYIDGYSKQNKYIATQGPLLVTVTDFWQLVWQEKVNIIAMVTNIKEHGTVKSEKYWPEGQGKFCAGKFRVTVDEQSIFSDYVIRTLHLYHKENEACSRKVTQYHFTSWPDHGVPEYAGPILNYLRRIKAQQRVDKGPILVHCSAGVGRTGTLIAIDIALAQASKERQVDIPKIIVDMRKQRMKMVQTTDQYALIHDAVLETIICGDTQIQPPNLRRAVNNLSKKDKGSAGKSGFDKQFEVLNQVSLKPSEVNRTTALMHSASNRSNNFLPPEDWRVMLKGDIHGYINASFANGYKQNKGFIIAQSPMESTVVDFVKMLYERECGVVVMLCGCEEGDVEMCVQYWPTSDGSMMKYGEFLVSTVSVDKKNEITQRVITISDPKSSHVQKVTQFQVEEWSTEGLCSSPQALIEVVDEMTSIQRNTGNKPIVVHGRDTVSRVGVFCSLVNAIEMCKTEGVVDVFQAVKALRIQKPGALLSVEQYCLIFDLVQLFLDSFSIYSNFK